MEDNLPPALLIDALALPRRNIVAHNLQGIRILLAQEVPQQGADDGGHAAAQHHNGHVVLACPLEEGLEARVEGDVLAQNVDALVEGRLDTVEHLLKRVAEGAAAVEHVLVTLLAQGSAVAEVVRHVIIAVLVGDGAVEVGEEDELGVRLERRQRDG